ncbi:hypothetical protein [Bacillus rubiinfantis]|uniref:hypothetical protein n=1 Tax=Bacillus rubiinfantis TaxID=1499680 RepID=UPI0005A8ABFB|nr:hypothetical protein [Bacillus rubiinfantis]
MTRSELFQRKTNHIRWKLPLLIIAACVLFIAILFRISYDLQPNNDIEELQVEKGRKVVIELPNGQKVYTYDHLIVEREGKTYYKGERNTIDLTGGKLSYQNWKEPK